MKIRAILEDGSERVYDVLSMEVIATGQTPRAELSDDKRKLAVVNTVKIAFGTTGPYVRWDGTGDVALGTAIKTITVES
jgi:hypothetical protein